MFPCLSCVFLQKGEPAESGLLRPYFLFLFLILVFVQLSSWRSPFPRTSNRPLLYHSMGTTSCSSSSIPTAPLSISRLLAQSGNTLNLAGHAIALSSRLGANRCLFDSIRPRLCWRKHPAYDLPAPQKLQIESSNSVHRY